MTSVVDPNEVTKFNQIARSYWDPEGPMRALHQINPLRIDFTESFYPLQDAKVLDVGCGGGLASEAMACLLYTSPSPRDRTRSRMPSSA